MGHEALAGLANAWGVCYMISPPKKVESRLGISKIPANMLCGGNPSKDTFPRNKAQHFN